MVLWLNAAARSRFLILASLHSCEQISVATDATVSFIRPFQLHGVVTYLLGLPGADIANFSIRVVIPALTGDGVGDGLAKFMRTGGSQCIENGQIAEATATTRVWHHCVKDLARDIAVIAAESLA